MRLIKPLIGLFFILFIIGSLFYGGLIAFEKYFWDDIYYERTNIDNDKSFIPFFDNKDESPIQSDLNEPFSILLLGTDSGNVEYALSDTLIFSIVIPKENKMYLLSIPRDTYSKIIGKDTHDKINAAHAYGGINMSSSSIEHLLDTKIDYYISTNLYGFQKLIDAIGGITIDVEKNLEFQDRLTQSPFSLNKGVQNLSGTQALNYARFRSDNEGDFGRMRRQQQVIKALADQSLELRNITKIKEILSILGKNIRTDIKAEEMTSLLLKLKDIKGENIEKLEMKVTPQYINNISYLVISEEELNTIRTKIKNILNQNDSE